MESFLVIFSAVVLSFWVAKVLIWLWWKPKKLEKLLREQGFNGTSHMFLFRELRRLVSMTEKAQSKPINLSHNIVPRVLPFMHETIRTHGPMSYTWSGTTPSVNILEPEHIRNIFSNKLGNFSRVKQNPLFKILVTGLVSYDGEKGAKYRKIITPAYHLEKLKLMEPAFYSSCAELVKGWEKLVSNGSSEVDVCPYIQKLTADVISRTAFGSSYEEGRRIFQLQNEQAKLIVEVIPFLFIPGFRYTKSRIKQPGRVWPSGKSEDEVVWVRHTTSGSIPTTAKRRATWSLRNLMDYETKLLPTKKNRRIKEIGREIRGILSDMINKRENATKDGEAHKDDLLGMLLESNRKLILENDNSKWSGMTIEDVIEECKLFYIAGHETTSSLLVWTMVALSMHPEWQARAREEVLRVFGTDEPSFDGLDQLKIVTLIFYEVLRLYPPFAILSRYCDKETKLGNFTLPPGVEIALPIIVAHHDHAIWGKDAQEFNPKRFSEGISKATNNQVSFFPFGWGPRICLGQTFGLMEAKLAMAMILQRFSFELSPTYVHAPYSVATLQPQHGAQIILHKL
ncbi:hypothetical protein Scep_028271 [Stephania cephalantha]|uniref:Cytochrome P450 n=1 Tax=Stephania cephalantha TaxID=152367 RepID=A0AAP0HJE1_9MAGN